jgi:hypothetical protein
VRYRKKTFQKNFEGKRYQTLSPYQKVPVKSSDIYVQVSVHDRLDLLAHKYYQNRDYWYIIAAANNLGKGTLYIQEGAIIRIPTNPIDIESQINKNGY